MEPLDRLIRPSTLGLDLQMYSTRCKAMLHIARLVESEIREKDLPLRLLLLGLVAILEDKKAANAIAIAAETRLMERKL